MTNVGIWNDFYIEKKNTIAVRFSFRYIFKKHWTCFTFAVNVTFTVSWLHQAFYFPR